MIFSFTLTIKLKSINLKYTTRKLIMINDFELFFILAHSIFLILHLNYIL